MDEAEGLDLEDLEARLYSQVYHGVAESEETVDNTNFDESSTNKKKYRYFDQKLDKSDPVLTQVATINEQLRENTDNIKDSSSHFVQENYYNTNDPSNTAIISTGDSEEIIQNITINQFSLPLIINPNDLCPSWLNFLPITLDNPRVGQSKKRTRKRKNSKINRDLKYITKDIKKLNSLPILQNAVTIYVSDSDSDDCVVLDNMNNSKQEINTKFPKKYNESEGGTLPEPDDDIIFVPPPPIEIINVEIDENEKSNFKEPVLENTTKELNYYPEEGTELIETPESTFSNDFLDNSNIETNNANFNFSLHGSEFRSGPSEILKGQKPTEYCETESSCSTNDQQSRDFSNTVKTIVFDEVEFPKEDIFSDKNLESFSSFITPKRSFPDKPNDVSKSTMPSIENDEDDISSDTSSSESDYESNANSKSDNLPNLSPMVPNDSPRNAPKKSAQQFLKPLTTKIALEEKEGSDTMKKPELPKNSKKKKDLENLKKKRQLNNDEISTENLVEENSDVIYGQLEKNCQSSTPNSKSKKKKKRDNSLLISQEEEITNESVTEVDQNSAVQESTANDSSIICIPDTSILDKTKKKKKKRESISEKDLTTEAEVTSEPGCNDLQQLNSDDIEADCNSEKSKKKKKRRENSETTINDQESAIDSLLKDVEITMCLSRSFGLKKKKKKKLKDGLDHEDKIKKRKKRKSKRKGKVNEFEENTSQVIEGTSESQVYDTPQSYVDSDIVQTQTNPKKSISNSVLVTENEAESTNDYIVVDSDQSSVVEILSTDTELDFEVLDDIGDDLSLNCSTSKQNLETVNVSFEEIDRVIKNARKPLEDCDQFDVETIQNQQSNDPDKWQISFRDRGPRFNAYQNRGPRCNRCRHFGHVGIRCPDKQHPQPCTLCGKPDHQEPRCPNKRCLQCGNPGDYSTTYCIHCFKFRNSLCMVCRMPGHIQKFCPDLWRRYHLTNDGPIVTSTARPISRNEQWCSGCAKQGHLEHECNYYNRQFPPTTPFIMNYNDVLNLPKTPQKNNLFQPMVNSPPIINEQIVHPPTVNMPSLGNAPLVNLPVVTPQIVNNLVNFLPAHGSNVPNLPTELSTKVMPHSATHNMTIQVSNTPTPNDIVLQMMLNFNNPTNNSNNQPNIQSNEGFQNNLTNNQNIPQYHNDQQTNNQFNNQPNQFKQTTSQRHNIDLNDARQIENFITKMPYQEVYDFIRDEIDYMKNSNIDPRLLKRKLIKYDRIDLSQKTLPPHLVSERNFWWRTLNMFILGVNKQKDGGLHVNHLTRYLATGKNLRLDMHKRRSLLSSYLYIFGNKKRQNVNYYKIIRIIARKYSGNSS